MVFKVMLFQKFCFVKIKGGLGNQIFQYALAKYIERDLGLAVLFDLSDYSKRSFRSLNIRKLGAEFPRSIKSKILARILWFYYSISSKYYYKESKLGCIENKLDVSKYKAFNGYWQTSLFIRDAKVGLKNILNQELSEEFHNEIAIHVRRGDYTTEKNQSIHGLCSDDYYLRAITYFKSKGYNRFRVYSDDLEYCRNLFDGQGNFYFGPHQSAASDVDEFVELANHTSGLIISNSTFSWWAAVFSLSTSVVYPLRWFSDDSKDKESENLKMDAWIGLD